MSAKSQILDRKWWYGGPRDIWIKNAELVAQFVRVQKLNPVNVEFQPAAEGTAKAILHPKPFPGGIRVPHLHWGEGLYLLDERQWSAFTARILKQYQAKLKQAGVNPTQEPRREPVIVAGPFKDKTFVITGALSQAREEVAAWIEARGGKVTESVSKKTSYVVVGDAPGANKVTKATQLNVPMISEDELKSLAG